MINSSFSTSLTEKETGHVSVSEVLKLKSGPQYSLCSDSVFPGSNPHGGNGNLLP